MAYIGREPQIGNFQVCDAISTVNNQAAYTMQVGGVNVSPESSQHMIVSLNAVIQKNGGTNPSFTVSGSTITFASNLVTGDVIDFIQILGNVLDLGVPSDSTVSLAKLTATGTKNSTTFLRGDNTFDTPPLGGITMADQWRITAEKGGSGYITANWERADTDQPGLIGSAMTQSSGVFTFPSTGTYLVTYTIAADANSANVVRITAQISVSTDGGSSESSAASASSSADAGYRNSTTITALVNVNNTTNVKMKFGVFGSGEQFGVAGNSAYTRTGVTFIRLGDST